MIHRALVGMPELIDLKRILVDDPRAPQVAADRGGGHLKGLRFVDSTAGQIEDGVHSDDLSDGQEIVSVAVLALWRQRFRFDRLHRCLLLRSDARAAW